MSPPSIKGLATVCAALVACWLACPQGAEQQVEEIVLDAPLTHLSLLADGGKDLIVQAELPGSHVAWHLTVLLDPMLPGEPPGRRLDMVPIHGRQPDAVGGEFLFWREIHGDCLPTDVRFFRKWTDGKVAGSYAVESTLTLGEGAEWFGDTGHGSKVLHRVFRLQKEGELFFESGYFRRVAQAEGSRATCRVNELADDIRRLVEEN